MPPMVVEAEVKSEATRLYRRRDLRSWKKVFHVSWVGGDEDVDEADAGGGLEVEACRRRESIVLLEEGFGRLEDGRS